MALSLYNTLTQRKEAFVPQEPGHARIYVCGPTVQDTAHVGHARCYTIYDVLVRHLRESGLRVTYVRNVTDVDDKIIRKAKETGETPRELSARIAGAWREDMTRLGMSAPDVEPCVSDHLGEIVALIEKLIAKGAAYAKDGDVYFRVSAFPGYGKLSHRKVDDLSMGASGRTSEDEDRRKEHPADFALWKGSNEEPKWPSPWGPGRPGWHIECSAMAGKYLGESFDLHGGGLDLVFPHHENEIAQSEAASGKPLATLWMHNGFVESSKEKMSKSLGNFFTVRGVAEKHEAEALRYYAMTVHYRSPLAFDWTLDDAGHVTGFPQIEDAERRVEYLYATMQRIADVPEANLSPEGPETPAEIRDFAKAVREALDDDLNMPLALAAMSGLLKAANEVAERAKGKKGRVTAKVLADTKKAFEVLPRTLGLGGDDPAAVLARIRTRRAKARGLTEGDVDAKIAARIEARNAKDFARADGIRDELAKLGVELMDSPRGTTWRIP